VPEGVEARHRIFGLEQHPADRLICPKQNGCPRPMKLIDTESPEVQVAGEVLGIIPEDEVIAENRPERDRDEKDHSARDRPRSPVRLAVDAWAYFDYSARGLAGERTIHHLHKVVSISRVPP